MFRSLLSCSILPCLVLPALLVGLTGAHGELEETIQSLSASIVAKSNDPEAREMRASLLLSHGHGERAAEDIDWFLASEPRRHMGLFFSARRSQLQGKLDSARAQIRGAIRLKPGLAEYRACLAEIETASGDSAAALRALSEAFKLDSVLDRFLVLAKRHKARGAVPKSLLIEGEKRFSGHPALMDFLFHYYNEGMGRDLTQAMRISEAAIRLWPRSIDWKLNHARTLMETKRQDEATEALLGVLVELDDLPVEKANLSVRKEARRQVFALLKADRADNRSASEKPLE